MILSRILAIFENWINPFSRSDGLAPPKGVVAFVWFYVSQAKWAFFAMLVLGGIVAVLEAGLFYFVGRLVDMLDEVKAGAGWSGLLQAHGSELAMMAFVVVIF